MLAMELIGMPSHAFQVRSAKPRKENQKHLGNFKAFFNHTEAPRTLRRTSLTFQLTGGVEAMVSEVPAAGKPLPMVRLCKNEAKLLVQDRLRTILRSMAGLPTTHRWTSEQPQAHCWQRRWDLSYACGNSPVIHQRFADSARSGSPTES